MSVRGTMISLAVVSVNSKMELSRFSLSWSSAPSRRPRRTMYSMSSSVTGPRSPVPPTIQNISLMKRVMIQVAG